MKTKFPIEELFKVSRRLPSAENLEIADFRDCQVIRREALGAGGRSFLKAYSPVMDRHMDLSAVPEPLRDTVQLATAHAMHRVLRSTSTSEATLAGVSLPVFTTQKLLMVMRAYPQLFALQLFGFLPMAGPTARLLFKVRRYRDALTGSSPNVASGDAVDDLSKFNATYTEAPEGSMARKLTFAIKHLDISAKDHRVLGEWTEQLQDDFDAVYDGDAVAEHLDECAFLLSWVIDRTMINSCLAAVPSVNKETFNANPSGYSSWTPDQQRAYDERLYSHGIVPVIEKIRNTNKYGPNVDPTWAIVGKDVARLLRRLKGWKARDNSERDISLDTGSIRDIGRIEEENLRILVDPQMDADKMLFGRRPVRKNEPGLYLGMYIPIQVTKDLYDPNTGFTTQGVRSRFAVAKPDTAVEAESAELARQYGELTVQNASAV